MKNKNSTFLATIAATVLVLATVSAITPNVQAEDDGEFVANPYCDKVPDNYTGDCHDRKDASDSTGLYTCNTGIHVKDYNDCEDATEQ